MLKLNVFSLLVLFNAAFAGSDHSDIGSAIHLGASKIYHDGDYIDFTLWFRATCYNDASASRSEVIRSVDDLLQWLNQERAYLAGGGVSYSVGLISVWKNNQSWSNDEYECQAKYNASQKVIVRLRRLEHEQVLDTDVAKQFFNSLQIALGSINSRAESQGYASFQANITSVQKDIFEGTVDALRIAAKAKAQEKATKDFLAFLGENYHGYWHLHKVDFSTPSYAPPIFRAEAGFQTGNIGDDQLLSELSLEPITFSIEGSFLFYFQVRNNYLP